MTGGSTYIVSLPRDWIQSAGLRKGDSVTLRVTGDGALVVDPSTPRESVPLVKSVEIATSMDQATLMRHLIGAYVTGYEVIEVRSKGRIPPDLRRVAQDFSKRVIGPEVIEENAGLVVLQDVADHADLDMRKVVRRMHLMATSMFEDSVRALTGPDESLADDVISRDDEVDRLHWFVEKQHSMTRRNVSFATKLKMSWLESDSMLLAARAVERIADHSTKIAGYTRRLGDSKADPDIQDALSALATETKAVLDESVASLFRRDSTTANSCIERTIGLRGKAESFVEDVIRKRGKGAVWFAFAAASIERVGGYSSDISEIAVNLSIGDDARP
jgi:phosphate uptake regulator